MLDIKRIREDFENVKKAVESRGQGDFGIDNVTGRFDKRKTSAACRGRADEEQAEHFFQADPCYEKGRKRHY